MIMKFHRTATIADTQKIDELTARISDLVEENTNLKSLDSVIRRNIAMFEALLSSSPGGITLTGADRHIVRVVKGLTGFAPRDLAGVPIESLTVPEDREIIVDCYKRLLKRDCVKITREVRVPRADGSIAWFSVTLTDMLDNPDVQCIVWNYLDITTQKEREAA
jgi:PAS domain S-box-containing protein